MVLGDFAILSSRPRRWEQVWGHHIKIPATNVFIRLVWKCSECRFARERPNSAVLCSLHFQKICHLAILGLSAQHSTKEGHFWWFLPIWPTWPRDHVAQSMFEETTSNFRRQMSLNGSSESVLNVGSTASARIRPYFAHWIFKKSVT